VGFCGAADPVDGGTFLPLALPAAAAEK